MQYCVIMLTTDYASDLNLLHLMKNISTMSEQNQNADEDILTEESEYLHLNEEETESEYRERTLLDMFTEGLGPNGVPIVDDNAPDDRINGIEVSVLRELGVPDEEIERLTGEMLRRFNANLGLASGLLQDIGINLHVPTSPMPRTILDCCMHEREKYNAMRSAEYVDYVTVFKDGTCRVFMPDIGNDELTPAEVDRISFEQIDFRPVFRAGDSYPVRHVFNNIVDIDYKKFKKVKDVINAVELNRISAVKNPDLCYTLFQGKVLFSPKGNVNKVFTEYGSFEPGFLELSNYEIAKNVNLLKVPGYCYLNFATSWRAAVALSEYFGLFPDFMDFIRSAVVYDFYKHGEIAEVVRITKRGVYIHCEPFSPRMRNTNFNDRCSTSDMINFYRFGQEPRGLQSNELVERFQSYERFRIGYNYEINVCIFLIGMTYIYLYKFLDMIEFLKKLGYYNIFFIFTKFRLKYLIKDTMFSEWELRDGLPIERKWDFSTNDYTYRYSTTEQISNMKIPLSESDWIVWYIYSHNYNFSPWKDVKLEYDRGYIFWYMVMSGSQHAIEYYESIKDEYNRYLIRFHNIDLNNVMVQVARCTMLGLKTALGCNVDEKQFSYNATQFYIIVSMLFLGTDAAPVGRDEKANQNGYWFMVILSIYGFLLFMWEHRDIFKEITHSAKARRRRYSADDVFSIPLGDDSMKGEGLFSESDVSEYITEKYKNWLESSNPWDEMSISSILGSHYVSRVSKLVNRITSIVNNTVIVVHPDVVVPDICTKMAYLNIITTIHEWAIDAGLLRLVDFEFSKNFGKTLSSMFNSGMKGEGWNDSIVYALNNFLIRSESTYQQAEKFLDAHKRRQATCLCGIFVLMFNSSLIKEKISMDNLKAMYNDIYNHLDNNELTMNHMIEVTFHYLRLLIAFLSSGVNCYDGRLVSLQQRSVAMQSTMTAIKNGTYDKEEIDLSRYLASLIKLRDDWTAYVTLNTDKSFRYNDNINKANEAIDIVKYKVNQTSQRPLPFSVYLYGRSAIGKTSMIETLCSYFHALAKRPFAHMRIGYVQAHDKYDSEINMDTTDVVIDDVDQFKNVDQGREKNAEKVLRFINVNMTTHIKADVGSKGNSQMLHDHVVLTSNVPFLSLGDVQCPEAIIRRVAVKVQLKVKPQFAIGYREVSTEENGIMTTSYVVDDPMLTDFERTERDYRLNPESLLGVNKNGQVYKDIHKGLPFFLDYYVYDINPQVGTQNIVYLETKYNEKGKPMNYLQFQEYLKDCYEIHRGQQRNKKEGTNHFIYCKQHNCINCSECEEIDDLSDTSMLGKLVKKYSIFGHKKIPSVSSFGDYDLDLGSVPVSSNYDVPGPPMLGEAFWMTPLGIFLWKAGFFTFGMYLPALFSWRHRRVWDQRFNSFVNFMSYTPIGWYARTFRERTIGFWDHIDLSLNLRSKFMYFIGFRMLKKYGLLIIYLTYIIPLSMITALFTTWYCGFNTEATQAVCLLLITLQLSFTLMIHTQMKYDAITINSSRSTYMYGICMILGSATLLKMLKSYLKNKCYFVGEALTLKEKKELLEIKKPWVAPVVERIHTKWADSTKNSDFDDMVTDSCRRVCLTRDGYGTARLHMFVIDEQIAVIPYHIMTSLGFPPIKDFDHRHSIKYFKVTDEATGEEYSCNSTICRTLDVHPVYGKRDLFFMRLPLTKRRSQYMTKFFAIRPFTSTFTGRWFLTGEIMKCDYEQLDYDYNGSHEYNGFKYSPGTGTASGYCGLPITGVGNDKTVRGIHVCGDGSKGGMCPILWDDIKDVYRSMRLTVMKVAKKVTIMTDYPLNDPVVVNEPTEIHPKNPANFMPVPVHVIGTKTSTYSARKNQEIITNAYTATKDLFNISTDFTGPNMNETRVNRKVMLGSTHGISPDANAMNAAVEDYLRPLDECAKKYKELIKTPIEPISFDEVVNGVRGLNIKPMPKSTSAGFGMKGLKRDYLDMCDDGTYTLKPELLQACNEALLCYQRGESPGFVLNAVLKNEALPLEEPKKLARAFFPTPLIFHLILARYLGPIMQFVHVFGKEFEIALGIDPGSPEWADRFSEILKNLKDCDPDKTVFPIDFGMFDLSCMSVTQCIIMYIILKIAKAFYNDGDVHILELILSDLVKSEVLFKDVIVETESLTGSGSFITALFQSIHSIILKRYSFYKRNPPELDFRKYCLGLSLGDDTSNALTKLCTFWGPKEFSEDMQELGYIATSALDKKRPVEFVNIHDVAFLKRKHLYNTDLGTYVGVLDKNSIAKSLMIYVVSRSVARAETVLGVYQNALHEFFLYGKETYEDAMRRLKVTGVYEGISPNSEIFVPYDIKLEEWKQKFGNIEEEPYNGVTALQVDLDLPDFEPTVEKLNMTTVRMVGEGQMEHDIEPTTDQMGVTKVLVPAENESNIADQNIEDYDSINYGIKNDSEASLGKFLSRAIELDYKSISATYVTRYTYKPWNQLLTNQAISRKLERFHGIRADVKLQILLSRPLGVYGEITVFIVPFYERTAMFDGADTIVLSQMSQYPHKSIDLSEDTSVEISIPYFHTQPYMSFSEKEFTPQVLIVVTYPISSIYGQSNVSVMMRVLANFENVKLLGASVGQAETITNTIEFARDMINKYEKMTRMLDTPIKVIKVLGNAASAFGFSEPNIYQVNPVAVSGVVFNTSSYNDKLPIVRLSADAASETYVNSKIYPYDAEDPMLFENVMRKPFLLQRLSWGENYVKGQKLISLPVTPYQFTRSLNVTNNKVMFSGSGGLACLYEIWHGGFVCFRFTRIGHSAHSGTIDITYDNLTTRQMDITLQKSTLWDTKVDKQIVVKIGWNSTKSALLTCTGNSTAPSGPHYLNGTVNLCVGTPLRGPSDSLSPVGIKVEVWCEGVRFAKPTNSVMQNLSFPSIPNSFGNIHSTTDSRFVKSPYHAFNTTISTYDKKIGYQNTHDVPMNESLYIEDQLTKVVLPSEKIAPITSPLPIPPAVTTPSSGPTQPIKSLSTTPVVMSTTFFRSYTPGAIYCSFEGDPMIVWDQPSTVQNYVLSNMTPILNKKFDVTANLPVQNGVITLMSRANFGHKLYDENNVLISPFEIRALTSPNDPEQDIMKLQVDQKYTGYMIVKLKVEVTSTPNTFTNYFGLKAENMKNKDGSYGTLATQLYAGSRVGTTTGTYNMDGMISPPPVATDVIKIPYPDGSMAPAYLIPVGTKLTFTPSFFKNGDYVYPLNMVYSGTIVATWGNNVRTYISKFPAQAIIDNMGQTVVLSTNSKGYIVSITTIKGTVGQAEFEVEPNGLDHELITKIQLGEDPLTLRNIFKTWTGFDATTKNLYTTGVLYVNHFVDAKIYATPYYFCLFAFMGARGNTQILYRYDGLAFLSTYGSTSSRPYNKHLHASSNAFTNVYELPYYSRELFSTPRAIVSYKEWPGTTPEYPQSTCYYGAKVLPYNVSLEPMGLLVEKVFDSATMWTMRRAADNFEVLGFVGFPVMVWTY